MKLHFDLGTVLQGDYGALFLHGIEMTLAMAALAWLLSLVVGVLLTIVRMTQFRAAEALVGAYVAYHRNVPMLVQILFWYFGISNILPLALQDLLNQYNSQFIFAVIAIGLCSAAYLTEDIRSGLRAISYGQIEATRALGLNFFDGMRFVVLPQALRYAIPPMINNAVVLLKNTSLAMAIGAAELTYVTRQIENETFLSFESYSVATFVYLGLSLVIMLCGARIAMHYRTPGVK
ncbi:amino acid ABC transporter permease [Paraburkholderia tropica]|uniref:Amino acid ABC transporter membrane protein 1, PAAT family n=1 Tax=Paraburkholderia tropica TaxID=92647 RepID=A0AAQ1JVQ0_9BURK|nr:MULTISPECIES: amino acid ABC transporter permease [Paraburkholderia]RQM47365.1 amino acid ABC transporter permease [Paraburkholderia bannensis]RQN38018.1 amino acid ABC transporter permease [Paraburkholderia tropica]SEJ99162.1 amino acid ABC transporter membrane protein 1, PAAT family [Paraburkholderia tropica]